MHFWTFRLQPPHAPLFRPCLLLRTGLTPASRGCAIGGSSDFALCSQSRQSHKAVSSSFRGFTINPSVLRTIHSLPVALHPVSPRRSYFPLLAFSSAREGLPPSYAHSISSARTAGRGMPALPQIPAVTGALPGWFSLRLCASARKDLCGNA